MRKQTKHLLTLIGAASLLLPLPAAGQDSTSGAEATFDQIWGLSTLYSNKDNRFVQKIAFTGRLQYDYGYFDEDDAGYWEGWQWRRARAGLKASVLSGFTVHVEADLDLENHDPVYNKLTDAYLGWEANDIFSVKLGKQSAGFTLDGSTSSKKLITAERSKLSDNTWFSNEYFTGASVTAESDNWTLFFGVFSNDGSDEFEDVFEEEYFMLASVGYDFGERLNVDKAAVRLDFVHNTQSDNMATRSLENVISLNGQYDNGRYHLWADLVYADAFTGNDLWGFELMPFIDINEMFQVVAQYSYTDSSDPNGLSIGRYERQLVGGRGDKLQVLYFGINTYFYGHKLKWQNGIQLTDMDDVAMDGGAYDGLGFTSAIRISW